MSDQLVQSERGEQKGPVTEQQLKERAASGQLKPTELVWKQGMEQYGQSDSSVSTCLAT